MRQSDVFVCVDILILINAETYIYIFESEEIRFYDVRVHFVHLIKL